MDKRTLAIVETRTGGVGTLRRGRCRTCRQETLTGLCDDICAITITVDPTPLNQLGEAAAVLAGAKTYALHRGTTGALRLHRRDAWRIASIPAGNTAPGWKADVVKEHSCIPPPPQFIASSVLDHKTKYVATTDKCPY